MNIIYKAGIAAVSILLLICMAEYSLIKKYSRDIASLKNERAVLKRQLALKEDEVRRIAVQAMEADEICADQLAARQEITQILKDRPVVGVTPKDTLDENGSTTITAVKEVISYETSVEAVNFINMYLADSMR